MVKNPVMYALAYKHEEDVWANFEKDVADHGLAFWSLLPSEQIAREQVEEVWGTDYEIVPVEIISYRDGVTHFEYSDPEAWQYQGNEEE